MKKKLRASSFGNGHGAVSQAEQFLARCDNAEVLLATWAAAIEIEPRLKNAVRFRSIKGAPFDASYVYLGQSVANRSRTHYLYMPRRVSVPSARRSPYQIATLDRVAQIAGLGEGALTPAREHALVLGHELGHIVLFEEQRANGIDAQTAQQEAMETLPLGPWPASELAKHRSAAWRHLQQHRPEYLKHYGVETDAELLVIQALAYRNLPDEQFADGFMTEIFSKLNQSRVL